MYSLLLLNGGVGARVAAGQPKQLIRVNNIPTMVYALVAADAVEEITEIVLNYPPDWRAEVEKVVADYAVKTPVTFVQAGPTRHDSVRLMLPHATNARVIIHETARPLVTSEDFRRLMADEHENVSFMLQIPFTVAPVEPETRRVTGYLERDTLRNVQLPQKFDKATLVAAHAEAQSRGIVYTEDATLCAVAGAEVFFLDGSDRNIKVTTKTDVQVAGHLLLGREDEDE